MNKTHIIIITTILLLLNTITANIPNVYTTTSECNQLDGGGSYANPDTTFTIIEKFTECTDGDTGTHTSAEPNKYTRAFFDIDGLTEGAYYLRFYNKNVDKKNATFTYYTNSTHVQNSINITIPTLQKETWYNVNITTLVTASFNAQGRVGIRIRSEENMDIGEIYLRQPITETTVDFMPQGVAISSLERWTENSWKLIADVDLQIDNINCIIQRKDENNTQVIPVPTTTYYDNTKQLFGVNWYTNATTINETYSYKVNCNVTIEGITFTDIYQFTYITREKSMWEAFTNLWNYITGFITDVLTNIDTKVNSTFTTTQDINETVNENQELLIHINNTPSTNYTPQLNRIEEKIDNLTSGVVFDLISR